MLSAIFIVLVVIFIFSLLILVHESGHLFAAKRAGIEVEAFSIGMGKRLFGIKIGETDYRVSLFPFGGYCKMAGEDPQEATGADNEIWSKPVGYRFWVIAAGPLANYVFAFLLFSVIFMMGMPVLSNKIGQVLNDYPAARAGIETGDRVLAINGKSIKNWDDILAAISSESKAGGELEILVDRKGREEIYSVQPEISEVTNVFGQTISKPMLGIAPASEISEVSYPPHMAFYYGGKKLLQFTGLSYKFLWLLVTGGVKAKESVSGPIGIAYLIKQATYAGIIPLLFMAAQINLALAIFNLLPFPVLDGGHILFLLIEKIRRRPLSVKVQEVITQVCVILILILFVYISWNDLLKFTPLGRLSIFQKNDISQEN